MGPATTQRPKINQFFPRRIKKKKTIILGVAVAGPILKPLPASTGSSAALYSARIVLTFDLSLALKWGALDSAQNIR